MWFPFDLGRYPSWEYFLQTFDFIGPVTSFHLAKNLGLEVVKLDCHLVRMASVARCSCPEELCRITAEITGDKLSVVDLVLWRYATLDPSWDALLTSELDTQIGTSSVGRRREPVEP